MVAGGGKIAESQASARDGDVAGRTVINEGVPCVIDPAIGGPPLAAGGPMDGSVGVASDANRVVEWFRNQRLRRRRLLGDKERQSKQQEITFARPGPNHVLEVILHKPTFIRSSIHMRDVSFCSVVGKCQT